MAEVFDITGSGLLNKYTGDSKDVVIPDGVTSIGDFAFASCKSLVSVTIPDGVTSIGRFAFSSCSSLRRVTIPDSVTDMGEEVFRHCRSLEHITFQGIRCKLGKRPFGNARFSGQGIPDGLKAQCFSLIPHLTDGTLKEYILETDLWEMLTPEQQAEVFLSRQNSTLAAAYLKCMTGEGLRFLGNVLEDRLRNKPSGKECSAVAFYMIGFKNEIPAERLQQLYALLKPVKAAAKALAKIENDLALKEILGQELTVDEALPPAERLTMERLVAEKRSLKDLENRLKELYGIAFSDLPSVFGKDGKEKEPYVLAWLLQAHESVQQYAWGPGETIIVYRKNEICPEAAAILEELDAESFQAALLELAKRFLAKYVNSKKRYLCFPISRYADETLMARLTNEAVKWQTHGSGIDAPPLLQMRTGCLYSNTRAAMLFADRYHELDKYAKLRGTDADTLRDAVLSEVGLDEAGEMRYDLRNTILIAALQDDLTLSLYDQGSQRAVKSVPKKKADPLKYEAAKKDLADLRKNIKKAAKARNNALFEAFLTGKKYEPEGWQKIHFSNPLINRIGRLLVWAQGDATFTLSAEGPACSNGAAYTIGSELIRLAHPMEMTGADIAAWQKYFTSHGIKQAFAQVWEPVIDPASVREDRYAGIVLPRVYFDGMDKHGITGNGFRAFSEEFEYTFRDCELELDPTICRPDPQGDEKYCYKLGKFSYEKYTRYTNHIVGLLDGWTVRERILKDDISVTSRLERFTLPQIMAFIALASEHNCHNVTAALLAYKNEHFADDDPMAGFWLEDF